MTGSEVVQVTAGSFSSRAPMRTPRAALQFVLWGWTARQRYTPSLATGRPSTTIFDSGQVRHLNKHINDASCCAPVPNPESETSLAQSNAMAITHNGTTCYVAALGSSKIGIYDTHPLAQNTFVPDQANPIELSGGGSSDLVLDDHEKRLFVLTRSDNPITVIDTTSRREVSQFSLYNPDPARTKNGRRFLYDARHSSAHSGNPDVRPMPPERHPMKGPITTQSLRGMHSASPMHWRGDHTAGNDEPTVEPQAHDVRRDAADRGSFNEFANFQEFQAAFTDLLGRNEFIADADGDEQAAGSDPADPHDTPLLDHN